MSGVPNSDQTRDSRHRRRCQSCALSRDAGASLTDYELFKEMYKIKVDETDFIKYKAVFSFLTRLFSI